MFENAGESAEYITRKMGSKFDVAIVLGSGLGAFADHLENPHAISFQKIPHFSPSTAMGHNGLLVAGTLCGKRVLCLQGRIHYFEGYDMRQVTYYVRVLKLLEVPALILTNAVGAIDVSLSLGDFVLINDHIKFMGYNPLIGKNDTRYGERFVDMTYAYDANLRNIILEAALEISMKLKDGVYVGYMGPSYETPTEIRMLRAFGGSVVGMSTVPEVIEANHCGIPVAAISCVANMAAGILDQRLSGEEVISTVNREKSKLIALLTKTVAKL